MGVRDEVVEMIKKGLSPVDIARKRGVSLATILAYVDQMIGAGRIRRSDVLFSVAPEIRHSVLATFSDGRSQRASAIVRRLERRGLTISQDGIGVIRRYGEAGYALGELYEDIRTIELGLHKRIRQALELKFGDGESGWWRQGIPLDVRNACQKGREEDSAYAPEPYCYTTIVHLKLIIQKKGNWSVLRDQLKLKEHDREKLGDQLNRLNQIRNVVMHPVRGGVPSESDFEFIRSLKSWLGFS